MMQEKVLNLWVLKGLRDLQRTQPKVRKAPTEIKAFPITVLSDIYYQFNIINNILFRLF